MLSIINAVEQRHKNGLTEKQRSFNNKKAKHWNIRRENYNSKKKTHENVTREEFTAAEKVAQRHQKKEVAS